MGLEEAVQQMHQKQDADMAREALRYDQNRIPYEQVLSKKDMNERDLGARLAKMGLKAVKYVMDAVVPDAHASGVDYKAKGQEIEDRVKQLKAKNGKINYAALVKEYIGFADDSQNNSHLFFNNLGFLFFKQNDFEKAANYYKRAVDLKANDYVYMKNLAFAYKKSGKIEEAISIYEEMLPMMTNAKEKERLKLWISKNK